MGRPPLIREKKEETVTTNVRLTKELRARIEAVAGANRMAIFIRQAVEAELERRERQSKE